MTTGEGIDSNMQLLKDKLEKIKICHLEQISYIPGKWNFFTLIFFFLLS